MSEYHRAEKILTSELPVPKLPQPRSTHTHEHDLVKEHGVVPSMASPGLAGIFTASAHPRHARHEIASLSPQSREIACETRQSEDISLSFIGGLWGAIENPQTPHIRRPDAEPRYRFEGENVPGAMIDWSMACRYLAALCLV